MDISECFALDVEGIRLPDAGADEDCLVTVAKEVIDADCTADVGIRAEFNAFEINVTVLKIFEDSLWQTEFRDTVAEDTADLVLALKDCDIVAVAGEDDCDCQTRRTGTDDCSFDSV